MRTVVRIPRRIASILAVVGAVLILSACGSSSDETPADQIAQQPTETSASASATPAPSETPVPPTDTPEPTATPEPTDTPEPTETPEPTATATPEPPTSTPAPTETPTPVPPTATATVAASATPAPTNTPAATATPEPAAAGPGVGKILFTSNRQSWDDCYVMNADGTNVQRLTTMGKCYDAHFTPDGNTIIYEHDDDIWKMNADGTGQVNLTDTEHNIEWFPVVSPDGSKIAYLFGWEGGAEIYVMNVDGSNPHPVTSREFDITPSWSPDGSQIAFASQRSGSWNIWAVNADGSNVRQVTQFGNDRVAISPVFSPDGNRIAFSTLTRNTAWEVWVVGLDGTNPHKVVGAIGDSQANSTNIVGWKNGYFLIGGYQGNWDPYFISESGGVPQRVIDDDVGMDDKPTDWWTP